MAYCETGDLLTGNIPAPAYLDVEKAVTDASDEMDSYLGRRYLTPITLGDDPELRAGKLMLKRINVHLASGRLIMAADAGGQDRDLHAYGKYLIKSALEALAEIEAGNAQIPGADPIGPETINSPTAPGIHNVDPESLVEAFSNTFQNPLLPPRTTDVPSHILRGG